jgi:lipopolysaccharide transport system ATP-binding protein
MPKPIIEVKNLSKEYILTHNVQPYYTLRDSLINLVKKPFEYFSSKNSSSKKEKFLALNDVSFSVMPGEVVGIIGRNGAGKSTLLKILSQITPPTSGSIHLRGRVASLLEVGTGFHPELTGRENIFLNGAILGMTQKEIKSKFDEIVEFAGIEKFLDTPVKRYSSGMYVRLAFAVAAHLEPEILIVDEVLAVGDAEFQKKCLGKMGDIAKQDGRTVLFVSHNMAAIKQLCEKCVWLESGIIKDIGGSERIVLEYLKYTTLNNRVIGASKSSEPFVFKKVVVKDSQGKEVNELRPKETFTVEINYYAKEIIRKPFFWVDIIGTYGHLFGASMLFDNLCPEQINGEGTISCRFSDIILLPQTYTVTVRAVSSNGLDRLAPAIIDVTSFQIIGSASEYGMEGIFAEQYLNHDTPMIIPYEWVYSDGTVAKPTWQAK